MNRKAYTLLSITALLIFSCSCKRKIENQNAFTVSPEAGTSYKSGSKVALQVHYGGSYQPDSIVYLVDSVRVGSKRDSASFVVNTEKMKLGPRVITAKIYKGGKNEEASTNIVLLASKPPEELSFKVVKLFPHDTSCYTEGLVYQDGFLYESGGGYLDPPAGEPKDGQSSLRKVDLNTGKIIKKVLVDPKVFAEGISIIDNKIIQLTWIQKIAYIYDKDTFKLLKTIPNNVGVEGWGLCFDGEKLYMDDKTNRIWFLNKDDYHATGYIDVYDDKGGVDSINELEFIDGKIYANIYLTNKIIVIDPNTGAVLQSIDLTNLYPEAKRATNANVLNGIAYDAKGKRLFITGKKWPNLYQVEFVKK